MPLVTARPIGLQNGSTVTEFTDTTNTSSVTYTYPTEQTSLVIENSGEHDIFVSVGGVTNQLVKVDNKWRYDGTFTSFSIRSDVNSQEFIATASYKSALSLEKINEQLGQKTNKHWIDITDYPYNAKGDGTTVNTTAIQNAINDVNTNGGGVVFVPKGTFLTDSLTLYSNVTLQGASKHSTILKLVDTPTGALLELSGITSAVKENMVIRNLTLKHRTNYTKVDDIKGVLVRAWYVRYVDIQDVLFTDFSVHGIISSQIDNNVTQPKSMNVRNCIFQNATGSAARGIFLYQEAEYVTISACNFISLTQAIQITRTANTRITDCTFLLCGNEGLSLETIKIDDGGNVNANKTIISNCSINHNMYIAITVMSQGVFNFGVLITNNNMLVCNSTTAYPCIVLRGVVGAIVNSNRLRAGNSVHTYGIQLGLNSSYNTDKCMISNNVILGTGGVVRDDTTGTTNIKVNNIENVF